MHAKICAKTPRPLENGKIRSGVDKITGHVGYRYFSIASFWSRYVFLLCSLSTLIICLYHLCCVGTAVGIGAPPMAIHSGIREINSRHGCVTQHYSKHDVFLGYPDKPCCFAALLTFHACAKSQPAVHSLQDRSPVC